MDTVGIISVLIALTYFTPASTSDADEREQCKSSLHDKSPYETLSGSKLACRHDNFITSFSLIDNDPDWSAYYITPDDITHENGGRRKFKIDPKIPREVQRIHSPCWGQKWNRGHLCPSYIMSYDKTGENSHW